MDYQFSDYMGNLSQYEKDSYTIVLKDFDNEIALDIIDKGDEEKYGIIQIDYDEEYDMHILFFEDERWIELMEEYQSKKEEE